MPAGNSIQGDAGLGVADGQGIRGEGTLGAFDSHSTVGAAYYGAFDSHSAVGEGLYGLSDSHSLKGEAYYGAFDSQSAVGGASVSGIPITIPGLTTAGGLQMGLFFKIGYIGYANNVVLAQLGLPSSGYINIGLTTTPAVQCGISASGGGGNWSLTSTSGTITVNTWYYLTYALGVTGGNVVQRLYIYQNGIAGFYDAGQTSAGTAVAADTNLTAVFGLGQITSSNTTFTSWQNFPNVVGWEISKFWLRNGNPVGAAYGGPNLFPLPTLDSQIAGMSPVPLIFYNCRQSVGTISTLTDNSGNGYHAAAGPNGLQVVADGPYA